MKSTTWGLFAIILLGITTVNAQSKEIANEVKFALLDKNADNKISLEEFKINKLKDVKPEITEKRLGKVEKKFALLDTNSDGFIDFQEYKLKAKKPITMED